MAFSCLCETNLAYCDIHRACIASIGRYLLPTLVFDNLYTLNVALLTNLLMLMTARAQTCWWAHPMILGKYRSVPGHTKVKGKYLYSKYLSFRG